MAAGQDQDKDEQPACQKGAGLSVALRVRFWTVFFSRVSTNVGFWKFPRQKANKKRKNKQMKTAKQKLQDLKTFLPNAKRAIEQTEKFAKLLENDPAFQKLWEKDSAAALRQVGINPDARMEMGLPPVPVHDNA